MKEVQKRYSTNLGIRVALAGGVCLWGFMLVTMFHEGQVRNGLFHPFFMMAEALFATFFVGTFWGLWSYLVSVTVRPDRLVWRSIFRERVVKWDQISTVYLMTDDRIGVIVQTREGRLKLYCSMFEKGEDLYNRVLQSVGPERIGKEFSWSHLRSPVGCLYMGVFGIVALGLTATVLMQADLLMKILVIVIAWTPIVGMIYFWGGRNWVTEKSVRQDPNCFRRREAKYSEIRSVEFAPSVAQRSTELMKLSTGSFDLWFYNSEPLYSQVKEIVLSQVRCPVKGG